MKISHEKPPNWDKLVEQFGAKWGETVVTYGDTCYCMFPPSRDLEVHELVHTEQQKDPVAWWNRYYIDPKFRFDQELEAYKGQYMFLKKVVKDRNLLLRQRDRLARDLSGPMYCNCVKFDEAFRLIG